MIIGLFKFLLSTVLFIVATTGHTQSLDSVNSATAITSIRVDGATYSVPNTVDMKASAIQLSQEQIHELAEETKSLKQSPSGFKPLITHLKPCTESYSRSVAIEHLPKPFFVVGDDEVSDQWIRQYKPILQKINAVGLVIQAQDVKSLERLHHLSGLAVNPANGDEVGKLFNINCYPMLITRYRIEN